MEKVYDYENVIFCICVYMCVCVYVRVCRGTHSICIWLFAISSSMPTVHLVLTHVTPLLSSFFFHTEDKSKNHSIVWEHWGPFNSLWDIKAHSKMLHY